MALPNKFFDYMHEGLPQLAMDFPEYRRVNEEFRVAILAESLEPGYISSLINATMDNDQLLEELRENCLQARKIYCWQNEEHKLIEFYANLFNE